MVLALEVHMVRAMKVKEEKFLGKGQGSGEMAHVNVGLGLALGL